MLWDDCFFSTGGSNHVVIMTNEKNELVGNTKVVSLNSMAPFMNFGCSNIP
jgi:hypothetical protein